MESDKIINHTTEISQHKAAKVAGFMFLFSLIIPLLNWTFVLSRLIVEGNALATADSIVANESLFRMGITIELFMSVGLIVLAVALYAILKPVDKYLALLGLNLKLVEATLMAVTVFIPLIALQLLNEGTNLTANAQEQLLLRIGLIFNSHTAITSIPMVFLGLDMMIFSYLFFKSKYIPGRIAGFGVFSFSLIFIHALMYILAPGYAEMPIIQIIFWTPSGLFEILIGGRLLFFGLKTRPQIGLVSETLK